MQRYSCVNGEMTEDSGGEFVLHDSAEERRKNTCEGCGTVEFGIKTLSKECFSVIDDNDSDVEKRAILDNLFYTLPFCHCCRDSWVKSLQSWYALIRKTGYKAKKYTVG